MLSRCLAGHSCPIGPSRDHNRRFALPVYSHLKAKSVAERQLRYQRTVIDRLAASAANDTTQSFDSQDEETLPRELTKSSIISGLEGGQPSEHSVEVAEERGNQVVFYVGGAALFGLGIWVYLGRLKAVEFFAGYLLEQCLSIDNLFVFILVFADFKTPLEAQGKVLTFGLLSAAVLRLALILTGAELIQNFQPVLLGFAGILLWSAWGLLTKEETEGEEDLSDNGIVKLCRRFLSVTADYDGSNFFTIRDGAREATPLLLVLAVIELSDVVFAVDSIPAVFGVTTDPFIIWTSNMWALLSLRSLYSFVAVAMARLRYLDKSVAVVLAWIGFKLGFEYFGQHIDTGLSLAVVAATLASGVAVSLKSPGPEK